MLSKLSKLNYKRNNWKETKGKKKEKIKVKLSISSKFL